MDLTSLPEIFQGVLTFILRNLRKIQGEKSVNSVGEPEIPQNVFEELLVNALIHRDYFICAPVRIFIFDDRIEIISPGNLPDHLTIEKIRVGNSIQRNPILTSFIAKGLMPYRGLGTGIRRALEDWKKIKFIDDRSGCHFTAIVERVKLHKNNDTVNDTVNDLQTKIVAAIRKNSKISYKNLADQFGLSRITISRHIQQLKVQKVIKRIGSDKKGHWEVVFVESK